MKPLGTFILRLYLSGRGLSLHGKFLVLHVIGHFKVRNLATVRTKV